jgi:hypothetical protein
VWYDTQAPNKALIKPNPKEIKLIQCKFAQSKRLEFVVHYYNTIILKYMMWLILYHINTLIKALT